MPLTVRAKLFLSHFSAILLVVGAIGAYFYFSAVSSLTEGIRLRLEGAAALVAQVLDASELDAIRSGADRELPQYRRNLDLLRSLERANADIAFLYVMRRSGGRVYFVLDSDASEDQAPPGREYPSHAPGLLQGFVHPAADRQPATDEWGTFMSGYAPLRNGNGEYLIGVDMRTEELDRQLQAIRLAALLSTALATLLALAFSRALSGRLVRPVQMLIARCRTMADGERERPATPGEGDEMAQLVAAFDAMSARLAESLARAERAQEALRQGRDQLEQRIVERTRDLVEVNERLLHEVAERARAEELLARTARSDPLTGLMNRRAMLEHLEYHAKRFERTATPFVVMLGDLDHFKSINDSFGHDAGDQALIRAADCLTRSVRGHDLVARWGGEELLILLPGSGLAEGTAVAEQVRAAIAAVDLSGGPPAPQLRISIGVAAYGAGQTLNQCIKAADMALYEAKRRGRNRVVVASV